MLFYDFEVFKYDWLVVVHDMINRKKYEIVNNLEQLQELYESNTNNIWIGFNNRHYDQYIMKGILLGMNPKEINDWIILENKEGWSFSSQFNKLPMTNYDVMTATGQVGLKTLEAFMGSDIRETEVDFNLDRKLTPEEIERTLFYCNHDVEETIKVFLETIDNFNAMHGIVKAFPEQVSLRNIGDSEARITSKVLGCRKQNFDDEFDYFFLPCIKLKKYKFVMDWFADLREKAKNKKFKSEYEKRAWCKAQHLDVMVAGIPHSFGFGGLHGATEKPIHLSLSDGAGYHVDVNNYYPSLLIAWGLVTRAATNDNFTTVYNTRKALKYKQKHAETKEEAKHYKKMQLPYKKMLNALSGAMKDATNPAYDPRNNNCMCINGQLMLLDLIEHLEVIPGFRLVQSNTDGLIVWLPDTDGAFDMMDDICWEWEQRCSTELCDIRLETDNIKEIYQRDVNNYLWVEADGTVERIGAVKPLSNIDNNLPIINKAMVDYMVYKTPIETTINGCNDLIMFQRVVKLSSKYNHVEHEHGRYEIKQSGVRVIKESYYYPDAIRYTNKSYRVFASNDLHDGRLLKCKPDKKDKFADTSLHSFIFNENVEGVNVPDKLNRQWYIDLAERRLKQFGVM